MTPQTPREQENELREKLGRFMYENYFFFQHLGCSGECNHKKHAESSLDELVSLIKQDREAYATQVKKKAELALVVDLEAKTADGEWLSMWIKNQYKRLVAHSQQESIYKKNADNFRREL